MDHTESFFASLHDARIVPHVASNLPAWVWSTDGERILFANAAGAAIFDADNVAAALQKRFDPSPIAATQIARLNPTLKLSGAPRLEKLRGFGAGFGRTLLCLCSRVSLGTHYGVLVIAAEPAGPNLSFTERIRRLIAGFETPLAAFSTDGTLIHANEKAASVLAGRNTLNDLHNSGNAVIETIGEGSGAFVLVRFPDAKPACAPEQETADLTPIAQAMAKTSVIEARVDEAPAEPVQERRSNARMQDEVRPQMQNPAPAPADAADLERREEPDAADATPDAFRNGADNESGGTASSDKGTTLTPVERTAFRELSSRLTARLQGDDQLASSRTASNDDEKISAGMPVGDLGVAAAAIAPDRVPEKSPIDADRPLLDRLPVGILIYRHSHFIYANPSFLTWTGHKTLSDFSQAGGLDTLFIETHEQAGEANAGQSLRIANPAGQQTPVDARLFTIPYDGTTAMALVLVPASDGADAALRAAETELAELKSILDIAADGVVIVDRSGTIVQANSRAAALFGADAGALAGTALFDLFAPDSARIARDYFDWLARPGAPKTLSEGRDVIGKLRKGGLISLHMTMSRIGEQEPKFCALIRDITSWKKSQEDLLNAKRQAEKASTAKSEFLAKVSHEIRALIRDITSWKKSQEDLLNAKRQAEKASTAKSEFLAKVSHEIRTPLNAIIGFSEVMMSERFGPVGNDRYKDYLHDIHNSGEHLVSLLNDLLDLSKIEAGKLELSFTKVNLNELTQQIVALMQPQAASARIIMRLALADNLPPILADMRSVRQIALNLLSNAIKFTGAGGQVIVSTALSDRGDVILRVKDSGAGMSEKDIETALEPFRQLATSARYGSGGTGLGLPLTKALTEANRATFSIRSTVNSGTMIEIAFPTAERR